MTALIYAAEKGQYDVCSLLLDRGASVESKNNVSVDEILLSTTT
jgi:ankyrin repeat protein